MELQHIQTGFSNFYMTNYSLFLVESHFDGSSDCLEILHFHLKTFCLFHQLEFHVAVFFSQWLHVGYNSVWQCCRAAWPIVIHRVHWAHSSWLAQSQVIHRVQSWGFGGLLLLRWHEKQECCFLLSPFSHSLDQHRLCPASARRIRPTRRRLHYVLRGLYCKVRHQFSLPLSLPT